MNKPAEEYYLNKIKKLADSEKRLFVRNIPTSFEKIKKIHISGVCGTATGSLAGLLRARDYTVTGSDSACYPPISDMLKSLQIEASVFDAKNLENKDLIICGNAVRPDNPEAEFARTNNLPQVSLPEAVRFLFLEGKKSLVVAGTHGKTTTSGLLAHIFKTAKLNPGFLVGGVFKGLNKSYEAGEGEHFIIEGDEYDTAYFDKAPKFLHYTPSSAIVTSVELDHIDIYESLEDYKKAFQFFVQEIKSGGKLFLCGDDANARALATSASCKVRLYGLGEGNDVTAENIRLTATGQTFDLMYEDKVIKNLTTPLFGRHNLLNVIAASALALSEGVSRNDLSDALAGFSGMKRRQEVIADIGGVLVIDDFAHHPTAVSETLKSIRERFSNRRIVAVFEPRSNSSRKKIFENEYGVSFGSADLVFLSIPHKREGDEAKEFIDPQNIVSKIKEGDKQAFVFPNAAELLPALVDSVWSGDVVIIMSNGSFDGLHLKFVEELKSKFGY